MKQHKSQPYSLVIITLNEEKNIEKCIRSVRGAAEVIVVDSGSQDRTVEIARSLGAKVIQKEWMGFSQQKTFAAEQASHDWILSLDADEALSPEAAQQIEEIMGHDLSAVDGFEFYRRTYHLGRWLTHGGNYPDRQVRLYNRRNAHWLKTNVHERIIAKNVVSTKTDILHWPFARGLFDQIATVNKYSDLRAIDFNEKGKKFSCLKMLLKTVSKFIEIYLLKRGFLDGRAGLISAMVSSFATFLRWAKLYEIQNLKKNK